MLWSVSIKTRTFI